MINIDIILPYKELFTLNRASAVSISVKNSIKTLKTRKQLEYLVNMFKILLMI